MRTRVCVRLVPAREVQYLNLELLQAYLIRLDPFGKGTKNVPPTETRPMFSRKRILILTGCRTYVFSPLTLAHVYA